MRRAILVSSVARHLGGASVFDVAWMWRRSQNAIVLAIGLAVVVGFGASLSGFSPGSSVAIGLAGGVVFTLASTEHRVVAVTESGVELLRGGKVRQVAVGHIGPLTDTPVVRANRFVFTEWDVDGRVWSVPRSSDQAMTRIAMHMTSAA